VISIGSQGRQTPPPNDEIEHPPVAEAAPIGPVLGATTDREVATQVICTPDDHPPAADRGGILPVIVVPSAGAREILLGTADVGGGWTICHVLGAAAIGGDR
jgi:hypothetical protein